MEDFSSGYNSKVLLVSLDFLKNILLCDSVYQCVSVLQYYGLNVDVHHQQVNFRRDRFLSEKPIVNIYISYFDLCSQINIFELFPDEIEKRTFC